MDRIEIELLPDGRVRIETDSFSLAHHLDAEELLESLTKLLGGKSETTSRHEAPTHYHRHNDSDETHNH